MTASAGAPITADERIVALDVLRGFALLGILLVNAEWFARPIQELGAGLPPGLSGIDRVLALGVRLLLEGKFWILFSLLFGMGFAVMLERASAAGRPFVAVYLRRIAALLLFGLAHACLVWVGDILHSYALAAVLLLMARNWSATTQLRVGAGGYVGVGLLVLLAALWGEAGSSAGADGVAAAERASAAAMVYANGDFAQITWQRIRDFRHVLSTDIATVPIVWLVFLIGAWCVRSGRMRDLPRHRAFFGRLALSGLPVGLGLGVASLMVGASFPPGQANEDSLLALALLLLGTLPLALGYLGLVMWLLGAGAGRALSWLAPAGRMALTNYLMQSLLATSVFYGYGLGAWGQLGYAQRLLLACGIFAAQVMASRWWLQRFRFGPAEWLWRWATYGRRPPMRLDRPRP